MIPEIFSGNEDNGVVLGKDLQVVSDNAGNAVAAVEISQASQDSDFLHSGNVVSSFLKSFNAGPINASNVANRLKMNGHAVGETIDRFAQSRLPSLKSVYASLCGIGCCYEWIKLANNLFAPSTTVLLYEWHPSQCTIGEEGDLRADFATEATGRGHRVEIFEKDIACLPDDIKTLNIDTEEFQYFLSLDPYNMNTLIPLRKSWPYTWKKRTSIEVSVTNRSTGDPEEYAWKNAYAFISDPECIGYSVAPNRVAGCGGTRFLFTFRPKQLA